MGLNAVLVLMPNRPHVQLILVDAKRGFGLGKLDVGLPELLIGPIGDVRTQEIGALRERCPVAERGAVSDGEPEPGGTIIRLEREGEAGGVALVLLQDPADLAVHYRRIEPFL